MVAVIDAPRLIEGPGTSETVWLPWLAGAPLRWLHDSPWLDGARRLVVVAPHPDDELLACGGLMAMHAERGGESLVVAVTDGEASHAEAARPAHPEELRSMRFTERLEGLRRLGVGNAPVIRLGLPHGAVAQHVAMLRTQLVAVLRPTDLVVATWRLDGHPDHDAAGRAAAAACVAVGCRLFEAPVWTWHWAFPGDPRVPWSRLAALPIDRQALQRKVFAVDAHTSQLTARGDGLGPVLVGTILERAHRAVECFFG